MRHRATTGEHGGGHILRKKDGYERKKNSAFHFKNLSRCSEEGRANGLDLGVMGRKIGLTLNKNLTRGAWATLLSGAGTNQREEKKRKRSKGTWKAVGGLQITEYGKRNPQ